MTPAVSESGVRIPHLSAAIILAGTLIWLTGSPSASARREFPENLKVTGRAQVLSCP